MTAAAWVVHKFGGTSVANAERYRNVARILDAEPADRQGVVVSAMSGVTDALIGLTKLAQRRDEAWQGKLEELGKRHLDAIAELGLSDAAGLLDVLRKDLDDVSVLLRATALGRACSEQMLEVIAGYGELWSAQILAAYLRAQDVDAVFCDAREVLIAAPGEIGPIIQWEGSQARMDAWLEAHPSRRLVITGYIASAPDGSPTTLKRNGSDFSAAIFGRLLDASSVTIWTDVDGVLSADPRRVPEAIVLPEMSYAEAVELAYFGAKVLHPRTMAPAVDKGIPIWIRNTFNASHPGTKIHAGGRAEGASAEPTHAVKGFSTVDDVALVNVEGTGMIGVPGIARRVFGALREVGVSVSLISQASSEHSICFAVPGAQGELARSTVERAFAQDVAQGGVERVSLVPDCSILAAVGDEMVHTAGVAAKFFGALGKAGVNVRAIAQGSSERNISAVVDRRDANRALRAVHASFYLSDLTLSVGLVGPGLVGRTLLAQLAAQAEALRAQFRIDLQVRAIADSRRMILSNGPIALDRWQDELASDRAVPTDLEKLAAHVHAEHLPHAVIIDCSASEVVADRYVRWMEGGIHVITPNKRASAGPLSRYQALRKLGRALRTHYFYEATVGAGLPVISTLRDLVQTGDRILKIEGVLSGTLAYVFNAFDGERPFSAVVAEAKRRGYTEPDPRDDLSGMDVARKLTILGREAGLGLELSEVQVESLVPPGCAGVANAEAFLGCLERHDAAMTAKLTEARAQGEALRYVGVVDADGRASVSLRRYPLSHPFARITGSDNIIAFTTERYRAQPLVVQGPGAGPDVTAGGVFADLLRLTAYLGAPS
ncbi:bifunctional aspartate kinase/homoserine dehydrogenase I [Polyangium aurulentum]|uniref:bifunctional aspartate kinase/homoserine dehydrogenase I n=1 Tax=Polyangium aurulentum TaxID=2567896 RepID=UPI0010AEA4E4|nr:bifunctional aspartate kinase/homoserine dehydrogenase I [Polyangium aurulentum]UQA55998.1 bifunctional aspartate kinase/homoserine dehydrogenase I [Polyangium aurulentum]